MILQKNGDWVSDFSINIAINITKGGEEGKMHVELQCFHAKV